MADGGARQLDAMMTNLFDAIRKHFSTHQTTLKK
jgi:hypothetical protein